MNAYSDEFLNALLEIDSQSAREIMLNSIEEKSLSYTIEKLIVRSLNIIGEKWVEGELALSQVYMSGKICEELVEDLLPKGTSSSVSPPVIAITVLGDYHLLGKKIVKSVLGASGFNIADFGQGSDTDTLAQKIIDNKIKILLISVLMLPSTELIRELRTKLDEAGYSIKILVGGAPFNFDQSLYQHVGADAMGASPDEAIGILNRWRDSEPDN